MLDRDVPLCQECNEVLWEALSYLAKVSHPSFNNELHDLLSFSTLVVFGRVELKPMAVN
jgi:hypothetical protein